MGRKFGMLGHMKNVVTYSLSPFEQRAFAGITKGMANFVRRVRTQLPYQLPAFITGILIYTWAMDDFHQRNRKNPKNFENDEWTFQHIVMWIFLTSTRHDFMMTSLVNWTANMMLHKLYNEDGWSATIWLFLTLKKTVDLVNWCVCISVINFYCDFFVYICG